ncbi:phosphotransferase [Kribbella sp. NPDC051770]|uniref:phosphotransferase n=1 Tax=Kribbella sp. NPDC051770 TaxID=3155413 RepID=UPI00342AE987
MDEVLKFWGLAGSVPRPVGLGWNNTSYFVGDFVLRVHLNAGVPEYEHAVLRGLGELSFAVPEPVLTEDGRTWVPFGERVASLCRRIPGEHPERSDLRQVEACGRALGELDVALAELEGLPVRKMWNGDLTEVHPLVPSPADLEDDVPGVGEVLARIGPRDDLPVQVIHGDIGPTNALVVGERVTGILDFEFTGPGYRAMDLETGLSSFGGDEWTLPRPWPVNDAFRRGYFERMPLSDGEIAALPWLQMVREATTFVHWAGRWRAGLTSYDDLRGRAERMLQVAELVDW